MADVNLNLRRLNSIPPEFKLWLKDNGLRNDFLVYRDDLKEQGFNAKQARERAILHFAEKHGYSDYCNTSSSKSTSPDKGSPTGGVPVSCSGPAGPSSISAGPILDSVKLADFEGRAATEAEIIRWVARHMEIADVTPKDCPDPVAWNMLVHCRKFSAAKNEFWRTTYPKLLPSRNQLEEVKTDDYDGKSMVDVIEQVQKIREGVDKLVGAEG